MNLIKGEVKVKVLHHVAEVLAYENFLSTCVAKRVDFNAGNFYTVDPAGRQPDSVENFAWSGGGGHDSDIAKRVAASLRASINRFIVIDDVMGTPADNMDCKCSASQGGELFHWRTAADLTEENISRLIWATSVSWHFLGVIFEPTNVTQINIKSLIGSQGCHDLGEVVEVIFGAYDGEGFIHWIRD